LSFSAKDTPLVLVAVGLEYNTFSFNMGMISVPGGVLIWPKLSPPRHADMLLVSIFQLFYKDPDLKHVGMTSKK
jgi:hypothetical protein